MLQHCYERFLHVLNDKSNSDKDDIDYLLVAPSRDTCSHQYHSPQYCSSLLTCELFINDLDESITQPWLSDHEFLRKCLVTRCCFEFIVNEIKDNQVFQAQSNHQCQASVKWQLMVFLHYIWSEDSASSNASSCFLFYIGAGTAELYQNHVIQAICCLCQQYIT